MAVALNQAMQELRINQGGPIAEMVLEMVEAQDHLEQEQRRTKDALITEIEALAAQKLVLIEKNKVLEGEIVLLTQEIRQIRTVNPQIKEALLKSITTLKAQIENVKSQIAAAVARGEAIKARQANQMYENHYVHTQWINDKIAGRISW